MVRRYHDAPSAGHAGPEKTLERIGRIYWWPGIAKEVTEIVQSCDTCQKTKARRGLVQPPLQPLPVPNAPWEEITMDFVTGIPPTERKHDAILVVVDRLSKMARFLPTVKMASTETTAQLLVDHIFCLFGRPKVVVSDRGPQFASKLMGYIANAIGFDQKLSTAYHPQTDGQTERVNQELEQYLRCYVNQSQDDWDLWLSMAEYAYNSRIHSATKKVPFELVLGHIPELVYKKGPTKVDEQGWIKRAEQAQEEAKKAMAKSQEQMERYANRHRAGLPTIEVGDKVLLDARNLTLLTPSRKLSARNLGLYMVIAKHGIVNYELDLPKDLWIHSVFHAGLIISYKKGDDPEGDH